MDDNLVLIQYRLRHRAQTLVRRTHAQDRHWKCHAHVPPRHPQCHIQPNVWLYSTCQRRRRSPPLLRHRARRTKRQNRRWTWYQILRRLLPNTEEVGDVEVGAHHRNQIQLQEWGRVVWRVSRNFNSERTRKHWLLLLAGHRRQTFRQTFDSSPESYIFVMNQDSFTQSWRVLFLQVRKALQRQ